MPDERFDRRGFAKLLAAGGAVAALREGDVLADDPARSDAEKPDDSAAEREEGPPPPPVLLTLWLLARYPHDKLDDDVLPKIEQEIAVSLYRGRVLAKYPFTNADEPAFVFSAYRADD